MKRFLLLGIYLYTLSFSLLAVGTERPEDIVRGIAIAAPSLHDHVSEETTLPTEMTLDTIFGSYTITEPVLIALLHHRAMTRLKDIDQHGPSTYFLNYPTFDRYTHSIGVFVLLRKFGASLIEQIAGLLHDASHTALSHLADSFFKTGNQLAYQDRIHLWHLKKMGVDKVLARYGFEVDDVIPEDYAVVKTKPPVLCADYLDYNIRAGLMFNRLTQADVDDIISNLRLVDGTWFFTTQEAALKFAYEPIYYVKEFLASDWDTALYCWTASALRQLVARDQISFTDIHFGTDAKIIDLLNHSTDKHVRDMVTKCRNPHKYFTVVTSAQPHDHTDHPKCRAINPLVLQEDGKKVLLTELDADFKKAYHDLKQYCQRGLRLKFIEPDDTPAS